MPDRRVIYDGLSHPPCTYAVSGLCLVSPTPIRGAGRLKNGRVGGLQFCRLQKLNHREKYANSGKNRSGTLPARSPSSRLPGYIRPLSSGQTSLRAWPGPPDRKLINECKRGNVVDKFNKIVHAQLVSLGVNTFRRPVPLPACRIPQLLTLTADKCLENFTRSSYCIFNALADLSFRMLSYLTLS